MFVLLLLLLLLRVAPGTAASRPRLPQRAELQAQLYGASSFCSRQPLVDELEE